MRFVHCRGELKLLRINMDGIEKLVNQTVIGRSTALLNEVNRFIEISQLLFRDGNILAEVNRRTKLKIKGEKK